MRALPAITQKMPLQFPLSLQQKRRIVVLLDALATIGINNDQLIDSAWFRRLSRFKTQKATVPFEEPDHTYDIGYSV